MSFRASSNIKAPAQTWDRKTRYICRNCEKKKQFQRFGLSANTKVEHSLVKIPKTRGAGQSIISSRCTDTCRMRSQWPRNQESERRHLAQGVALQSFPVGHATWIILDRLTIRDPAHQNRTAPVATAADARPALFGFLSSSICDPVVFPSVLLWALQRRTIKWNDHRQDTPHLLLILSFPPPRVALLFSGTATSAQLHYDHSHQCGRLGWDNHWLFLVSRLKELMESATSPHIPHIYTHTHPSQLSALNKLNFSGIFRWFQRLRSGQPHRWTWTLCMVALMGLDKRPFRTEPGL